MKQIFIQVVYIKYYVSIKNYSVRKKEEAKILTCTCSQVGSANFKRDAGSLLPEECWEKAYASTFGGK